MSTISRSSLSLFSLLALLPASAFAQLSVATRLPDNNAKSVPADTLLSITFNAPPKLGAKGEVRIYDTADNKLIDTLDLSKTVNDQTYTIATVAFHAYPILISGNTATIHPHNNLLTYGKTYCVQIDPGVLTDDTTPFAGYSDSTGWVFSTKAAPPAATADKLTISADNTADFATIQGAIDFVPAKTDHITLFLKNGDYHEIVSIVDKTNITIQGEDRAKTVLSYPNNEKVQLGNGSSNKRGVVDVIRSTGIAITNMTINNATPKGTGGGWQAEAIISKSNSKIAITNVNLHSFQDTLQISSPGYVANSYIEGDVDFMWGTGPCFFQDCSFKALNDKDAFVVSRNNAMTHGFVYVNCKFDTAPGVTGSILGNNQNYGYSEVVLLNCAISPDIDPTAWRGMGPNVHYWEFNSTNIRDGSPADTSKRAPVSKRLTKEADADTIAKYSDPAFVLGGWKPEPPPSMGK